MYLHVLTVVFYKNMLIIAFVAFHQHLGIILFVQMKEI